MYRKLQFLSALLCITITSAQDPLTDSSERNTNENSLKLSKRDVDKFDVLDTLNDGIDTHGEVFDDPFMNDGTIDHTIDLDGYPYLDSSEYESDEDIEDDKRGTPMGLYGQLGKRGTPMGFYGQLGKRGAPMGFYGQLGKRGTPMGFYGQLGKRGTPMGFYGQLGKRGTPMGFYGQLGKRGTPMGFYGQLGKRGTPMGFYGQLGKRAAPMGFYGQLGKRAAPMGFYGQLGKRAAPMGFFGQLGKRGPMGLYGQLGKRTPYGLIGQLGKRSVYSDENTDNSKLGLTRKRRSATPWIHDTRQPARYWRAQMIKSPSYQLYPQLG